MDAPLAAGVRQHVLQMQAMQQTRALRRVNELADVCFDACVTDFSLTRQLMSGERACLEVCAHKYLAFSALAGQAFVRSLATDARFKPA
ncbi:hypothetical protein AB1Y20_012683 [Prymnesium parvum]|uniref:Mitochondrial import inner membrane translocase subunit n=1 Tax=Prymnesium parvum TaxID=97485 RepID=A0AB34IM45_PRYPA